MKNLAPGSCLNAVSVRTYYCFIYQQPCVSTFLQFIALRISSPVIMVSASANTRSATITWTAQTTLTKSAAVRSLLIFSIKFICNKVFIDFNSYSLYIMCGVFLIYKQTPQRSLPLSPPTPLAPSSVWWWHCLWWVLCILCASVSFARRWRAMAKPWPMILSCMDPPPCRWATCPIRAPCPVLFQVRPMLCFDSHEKPLSPLSLIFHPLCSLQACLVGSLWSARWASWVEAVDRRTIVLT